MAPIKSLEMRALSRLSTGGSDTLLMWKLGRLRLSMKHMVTLQACLKNLVPTGGYSRMNRHVCTDRAVLLECEGESGAMEQAPIIDRAPEGLGAPLGKKGRVGGWRLR